MLTNAGLAEAAQGCVFEELPLLDGGPYGPGRRLGRREAAELCPPARCSSHPRPVVTTGPETQLKSLRPHPPRSRLAATAL